jgi:peroxiredoxin
VSVADSNKMKPGASAPDFKDLPGVDGKRYGLKDLAAENALVIFFSCNHCPYVQAYEDRVMELQNEFRGKGVRFVAINANDATTHPDDSFDNMVARAKERKFNFLYLRDEGQDVARAFGATHTPHLFVFDKERRLRYTGRIDDNWQEPEKVTRRYLRDALNALTQGQAPAEAETFAIGCTIKWKR